uniref:Transmembrane protein n=1 Tax=Ditylenchus dipsaci TaxID=166011 RepID=A0A915EEG0_9BILA
MHNANVQLLEEFDVEITQNEATKHLKNYRILKSLIFAVVVIVFCCVIAFSNVNSTAYKNTKSRRALPTNPFPQAPPRPAAANAGAVISNQLARAGTQGMTVNQRWRPSGNPAPVPAQSPAGSVAQSPVSPQSHISPQNQASGLADRLAPALALLPGSQTAQQAAQHSQQPANLQQNLPTANFMQTAGNQNPAEDQEPIEVVLNVGQDVREHLGFLEPEHVDWAKEPPGMRSERRKNFALEWMESHAAMQSETLNEFAANLEIGAEALRKWMIKNRHRARFTEPMTMYRLIKARTDFTGVNYHSLPDGMRNPIRRERMKDLLENHPDFTDEDAADELGQPWITVENQDKKRQSDNVKDSNIKEKKRLTDRIRITAEPIDEDSGAICIENEATAADSKFMETILRQFRSNEISLVDVFKKTGDRLGLNLPNTDRILRAIENRVAASAVAPLLNIFAGEDIQLSDQNLGIVADGINTVLPVD